MKRGVTLLLLCLAPAAIAQERKPAAAKRALEPGQTLDGTLAVIDLKGQRRELKDLFDKVTVVNFFSTEAAPQRACNERFAELQQKFAGREVRFLHINSNAREVGLRVPKPPANKGAPKPYSRLHKHLAKHKLPFDLFVDHGNKVADALGATTTPHVFVFAGSKLIYRGVADDKMHNHVLGTVHKLLAHEVVKPFETKPKGAPISRADSGTGTGGHTIVRDNGALAVEAAMREHKLVLYNFTGFNCGSCRIMEDHVFKQPEAQALLRKHVVEARLHTDTQNNMTAEQFAMNRKLQKEITDSKANPYYVVVDPTTNQKLGEFTLSGNYASWPKKLAAFVEKVAAKAGRPVR